MQGLRTARFRRSFSVSFRRPLPARRARAAGATAGERPCPAAQAGLLGPAQGAVAGTAEAAVEARRRPERSATDLHRRPFFSSGGGAGISGLAVSRLIAREIGFNLGEPPPLLL